MNKVISQTFIVLMIAALLGVGAARAQTPNHSGNRWVSFASAVPASAATPYTVVEGCAYPNGWNSVDLSREINGTPQGLDHQCTDTYQNGRLIHRQQAGYSY